MVSLQTSAQSGTTCKQSTSNAALKSSLNPLEPFLALEGVAFPHDLQFGLSAGNLWWQQRADWHQVHKPQSRKAVSVTRRGTGNSADWKSGVWKRILAKNLERSLRHQHGTWCNTQQKSQGNLTAPGLTAPSLWYCTLVQWAQPGGFTCAASKPPAAVGSALARTG